MKTVSEIMTRNVRTVDQNEFVSVVVGILDAENLGGAPLVDETGTVVGIVTKSDIVHFEFVGGDPFEARVSEIASHNLLRIDGSSPIVDAARTMLENDVNQLVVFDDEGVVGLLRAMDFVALTVKSGESSEV